MSMPSYETGLGSTGFSRALSPEPLTLEPPSEDASVRSPLPVVSGSFGSRAPMTPRTTSAPKTEAATIRPGRLVRGAAGWNPGGTQPVGWEPGC